MCVAVAWRRVAVLIESCGLKTLVTTYYKQPGWPVCVSRLCPRRCGSDAVTVPADETQYLDVLCREVDWEISFSAASGSFCGLDDNMDVTGDYIWQCRIHHGVRHQKGAVPFPESVKMGLEFNAALERKEKFDLSLLTNAVMLELCDFAKTVTKSETYFFFEMLQFNFDLGVDVDNDMQCYEYARRVHGKIKLLKEQIKVRPHRWTETFPLPFHNSMMAEQSGRYCPKRNKRVDSSVLTDGSKNSKRNGASSSAAVIKKPGGVRLKLTDDVYPFCKELGVTLFVLPDDRREEKLHPSLITNGVMMELLDFSRVLCGTHTQIVNDLVRQNFGHELDKMQFRLQVAKLMERKYACVTAEDRDAFQKEAFKVQTRKQEQNRKKRKNPDADFKDLEQPTIASKRRDTTRHNETCQDIDLSYMCPVDLETETEARPEKLKSERCLSGAAESAVPLEVKEEEVSVSSVQPHINLCPKNVAVKTIWDLFSEDKTEDVNVKTQRQKLWTRRATRSKQILKSSRVNDMFARCRAIGFDFNVGSGNKQKVNLHFFTNRVLWEVYKFATAMTKSLRSFLFEILNNNFKLVLQDEIHRRNFTFYMITKEKVLQNHSARQKEDFLSSRFQFPEVYNMVDVGSDFQTVPAAETEQQTDGHPAASATSQEADYELHPFCKQLGLDLWAPEERPASRKLDLTALTTGAVLEIFIFVRELCGAVRDNVNDVLEHNLDLDLQSGSTEAAQVIQRWYVTQKSLMKRQTTSPKINRWLNTVVPLNGFSQPVPRPPTCSGLQDLQTEDLKPSRETGPFIGNVRQVKRLGSFHICNEIGLDLDVGSKSEAKTKLDLRVLTRGALFEMHQYVAQNCHRYVPALFEILEYNFDLSSQSHRKVEFAWSIASQAIAIAGKNGRKGDYLNKVFELPFEDVEVSRIVCKDEPEDDFGELNLRDNSDIVFVRKLKPVDIDVVID